jgi:hypothetical protein
VSAAAIAAALGLLTAPALGATVAEAFDQMGLDALFGPNCSTSDVTTAIIAPPRWRSGVPKRWQSEGVTLVAEIGGSTVSSVHVAKPTAHAADEPDCMKQLVALAGPGAIDKAWRGPDRILTSAAPPLAGYAAHYRAVYNASRHECRTMLTIAAEGTL